MIKIIGATLGALAFASVASAATLTLSPLAPSGSPSVVPVLGGGTNEFGPLVDGSGASVDLNNALFKDSNGVSQLVPGSTPVSTFDSTTPAPGLTINGSGTVTVTFLGKEAGLTNVALEMPGNFVTTADNFGEGFSFEVLQGDASSLLPFVFKTAGSTAEAKNGGPIGANLLLSFTNVFNDGTSIIALFEDNAGTLLDIDDMVVRIDVAPIPLPAGVWLFATALGGLAVLRRRQAA